MRSLQTVALALAASLCSAAPASRLDERTETSLQAEERGLVGGLLQSLPLDDVLKLLEVVTDPNILLNVLDLIQPAPRPGSYEDVQGLLSGIYGNEETQNSFYKNAGLQISAGLGPTTKEGSLRAQAAQEGKGINSPHNKNAAVDGVYPQKAEGDAPYSVPEDELRAAIYIPDTFTYGKKPPVLFVPGTGSYGGSVYKSNLAKLLAGTHDPVWLNVPGNMLLNAQVNAEYVAYAVNYLAAASKTNISAVTWSQGGLDMQWALTYWPSTRAVISNFFPVSADFHGTYLADVLCLKVANGPPASAGLRCAPALQQQRYNSTFVSALRAAGGADAYVPTTSFYSGRLDEVVQPQVGTGASAYIGDARGVGALNVQVEAACGPDHLVGGDSFYDHAGVLYHPLTYALIVDAIAHGDAGDLSRIDIDDVCSTYATRGLSVVDVVDTVAIIPIGTVLFLTAPEQTLVEPPLMPYVTARAQSS